MIFFAFESLIVISAIHGGRAVGDWRDADRSGALDPLVALSGAAFGA
jgi:hypothetical protein